ncbi:MAG: ATP-binding protein [Candidatus Omnitrophica bacterium]|nr:ATP-binding protein [Candidatus Omnitrophota bacterium]
MKLRHKIISSFILVIAVLSIVNILSVVYAINHNQEKRLQEEEVLFAQDLAARFVRDVVEDKADALTDALFKDKKLREEMIEYILVFDKKGYLLSNTYLEAIPKQLLKLNNQFARGENFRLQKIVNRKVFVYDIAVPVREGIEQVGAIHIGFKGIYILRTIKIALASALVGVLIIITIAVLFGLFISETIVSPIGKLKDAAAKIGAGSLKTRVSIKSADEIGALADSFNRMAARLEETTALMIQAEKFEAIGRLASGVAHEVKNPLGVILQGINYLEGNIPSGNKEASEVFQLIKDSIVRADNIVRMLLDFSRVDELYMRPEDANILMDNSLLLVQQIARLENIEIVRDYQMGIPKILADKSRLEQVFINLFTNAFNAMPGGGRLTLRSYLCRFDGSVYEGDKIKKDFFNPGEETVAVEVEDTGQGISEDNLKKIFEPFFTTKGPGKGTGLGLSVTNNIIKLHGGIIEITSQLAKGTKIKLLFKVARSE